MDMAGSRRFPRARRPRRESKTRATTIMIRGMAALLGAWAFYLVVFSYWGIGKTSTNVITAQEPLEKSKASVESREALRQIRGELLESLFRLGERDPAALVRMLEEEDPLQVSVANPDRFQCPLREEERFSLPDTRNRMVERDFKEGRGFIYYQHLRKAGGTGFCEMAGRNMVPVEVPKYHCMPDNRGGMATPPWSNQEYLLKTMKINGFRITANEWDAFPKEHLSLPGAVFATTFRHPVDRWFSQYRFEHVEHRDGTNKESKVLPFDQWYKQVKPYNMGDNYYVKTFCGLPNPPDSVLMTDLDRRGKPKHEHDLGWSYHKFNQWGAKVSWDQFSSAIKTLKRFNLILLLDFVDDEMWALEESLGWTKERKVVLPHEMQAVRPDKKSISAREVLDESVWAATVQSNVFDLLLFHWAKRIYLERSACRLVDKSIVGNLPPRQAAHDLGN